MARRALSALLLTALACDVAFAEFGRHSFPEGFVFGTGSAAYQVIDDRCSSLLHIPDSVTLPPLCLCVQRTIHSAMGCTLLLEPCMYICVQGYKHLSKLVPCIFVCSTRVPTRKEAKVPACGTSSVTYQVSTNLFTCVLSSL